MFTTKLALSALVLAAALGCSAANEIENKITCGQVCDRYKECFDSEYNVEECTNSCESEANSDEDKDRRLEECDACIDDRSCSEATFNCATECAGILL